MVSHVVPGAVPQRGLVRIQSDWGRIRSPPAAASRARGVPPVADDYRAEGAVATSAGQAQSAGTGTELVDAYVVSCRQGAFAFFFLAKNPVTVT